MTPERKKEIRARLERAPEDRHVERIMSAAKAAYDKRHTFTFANSARRARFLRDLRNAVETWVQETIEAEEAAARDAAWLEKEGMKP